MQRNEMKNIALAVVFTAIICVAAMAVTLGWSIQSKSPHVVYGTTPGYQQSMLVPGVVKENEARGEDKTPDVAPIAVSTPIIDGFQSAIGRDADRTIDPADGELTTLASEALSDWFIDKRVTIEGNTAYVESPQHAYAFTRLALPARLFGSAWNARVYLDHAVEHWAFTVAGLEKPDGLAQIDLNIIESYMTRLLPHELTLKEPACATAYAPDIAAATSLLSEYYGSLLSDGIDPCSLVTKIPVEENSASWWASGADEAHFPKVAMYVFHVATKPMRTDGPMRAYQHQDYHPAVIMRADEETYEGMTTAIRDGKYRLIEMGLSTFDNDDAGTYLTQLSTTADAIYQSMAKSTVDVECGYDYCF